MPDLLTLRAGDTEATIAPAVGANCFRLTVAGRDLVEPPPTFDDLVARPTGYGCPILFPFPGQLLPGRLTLLGRDVQIEANGPNGRHGHGFAPRRPWRILERAPETCACQLQGGGDDEYPWRYRLTARFRIAPGLLGIGLVLENLDHAAMAFGLGLHPYTPIAPDATIDLPATALWPADGGIPRGQPRPTAGPWRWDSLPPVGSTLVTGLPSTDVEAVVGDVLLRWPGDRFGEVVLYRPPERASVCVEPWTSVSNAAAQIAPGAPHGLVVLPAYDTWRGWLEIAAR